MNRSDQIDALLAALAKAQAEMPAAGKRSDNPFFKSKYADFNEIVKASRPSLSKNGLSVMQMIRDKGEYQVMETMLGHSSGQFVISEVKIAPAKSDVQSLGSYLTYLKRYSYAAIVGVVIADEDDDGESAMQEEREYKSHQAPPVKTLSETQVSILEDELGDRENIRDLILSSYKVKSLRHVPAHAFEGILKKIRN